MADKKLNEVPVVSDIVTIFGKRSNGEIVQIDKSNLATLLGGLIGINDSWFRYHPNLIISRDLNDIIENGAYYTQANNVNSPISKHGNLFVCGNNVDNVVQKIMDSDGNIYIRLKLGSWLPWKQIVTK
jgi:hypothetical protein